MIVTMTSSAGDSSLDYDPEAASNGDDEGIEKDADVETRCSVLDVIKVRRVERDIHGVMERWNGWKRIDVERDGRDLERLGGGGGGGGGCCDKSAGCQG